MALQRIFDRLLLFPVFQGVGVRDLEEIITHTRFDFHTVASGKTIIHYNDEANKLFFLLSGKMLVEREADDHSYRFIEELSAPIMLQPEAMWSQGQKFTMEVKSLEKAGIMTVDKTEVMRFLDRYPVVRLNMMNLFTTHIQHLSHQFWRHHGDTLEKKFTDFLLSHCQRPAGRKLVKIKMVQLAQELNASRLDVSIVLNNLDHNGLLRLFRGGFEIPAMELLINRETLK